MSGATQNEEFAGTYTIDPVSDTKMGLFVNMHGTTINLYDNGVIVDGESVQISYDTELASEGVLKMFDNVMNDYVYYKLNVNEKTVTYYDHDTQLTPTDYTCSMNVEGTEFPATVSIYGGYDETPEADQTRMADVTVTFGIQPAPFAFVQCTWIDADTVMFGGRTYNVTSGNVLVEVTE